MKLIEKFRHNFEVESLIQGQRIFAEQQVHILQASNSFVQAEIHAKDFAECSITVDKNQLKTYCDCEGYLRKKECPHLLALILQSDKQENLSQAAKRSVKKDIPKKAKDEIQEESTPFNEKPKALSAADQLKAMRSGKATKTLQPTRLLKKLPRTQQTKPSKQTIDPSPQNFEIFYLITLSHSKDFETLHLSTFWKQGSDGQSRPFNFNFQQSFPTDTDQNIFTILQTDYVDPNLRKGGKFITKDSNEFLVTQFNTEKLLPLLHQSKRCFIRTAPTRNDVKKLSSFPEPFKFCLNFDRDAERNYLITGLLQSASKSLELDKCTWISGKGLALYQNCLIQINERKALDWLKKLRKQSSIKVPYFEAEQLLKDLIQNTGFSSEELPDQLNCSEGEAILPRAELFTKTAQYKHNGREQLHAELNFNYQGEIISEFSKAEKVVDAARRVYFPRNIAFEEEARMAMRELDFRFNHHSSQEELGWKLLPSKLDNVVRELIKKKWLVTAQGKTYRSPKEFNVDVTSGKDWFEVQTNIDFDGQTPSQPEILEALRKGENHVILDDGSFGVLPLDWLRNYTVLYELGETLEESLKLKKSQAMLIDMLLRDTENANVDEDFKQTCISLKEKKEIRHFDTPQGLQATLRPYQQEGYNWMRSMQELGFGICLADDMGLGKTIQILTLLLSRFEQKVHKPSLVIVPRSLIFNWQAEAEKFCPDLKTLNYTGLSRKKHRKHFQDYQVIITTYGTLKNDVQILRETEFDYCILDEAQAIKNADTSNSKSVRLINAQNKVSMSGTPIENHLGELWSQFRFLNPAMTNNKALFEGLENDKNRMEKISDALRPFILRRTKKAVAKDLPEKIEQVIYCEMEEEQKKVYDELKEYYRKSLLSEKEGEDEAKEKAEQSSEDDNSDLLAALGDSKQNKVQILEALLRLRQAACHPALINESHKDKPSVKYDILFDKLKEIRQEGAKTLIFSQFVSMLDIMREGLEAEGIPYCYLDGQTEDRQAEVDDFQNNPDKSVFLISLKAGGVGLNLTAASYVFLIDPWWNPAIEAQAVDRAYRIGQKNTVIAYRMIAKDTVEEKIHFMQQQKSELADNFITGRNSLIKSISPDELNYLFS